MKKTLWLVLGGAVVWSLRVKIGSFVLCVWSTLKTDALDFYRLAFKPVWHSLGYICQCLRDGSYHCIVDYKAIPGTLSIAVVITVLLVLAWLRARKSNAGRQDADTDEPIATKAQDRLGRQDYVDTLLELICKPTGQGALVVGVYGDWGEGKSSVMNLAKERAKERAKGKKDKVLKFVDFQPWAFIEEKDYNAELVRRIGSGCNLFNLRCFYALVYACKLSVRLSPSIDGFGQAIETLLAKIVSILLNQDYAKSRLRDSLKEWSGRIVVGVDDLDRLTREEVAEVIRAIKTNGDLPNVVYLLLSDEDRLASLLKEASASSNETGREYLEKIVQYPFPLWPLKPGQLAKVLGEMLKERCDDRKVPAHQISDDDRKFCLKKISNMRQVKRLVFAFDANLAYYQVMARGGESQSAINLHLGDVLRLSALRLHCPAAVEKLYGFYSEYCDSPMMTLWSGREIPKKEFEEVLSAVPEDDRDWYKEFLEDVMWIKTDGADNYVMAGIDSAEAAAGLRMSSPANFFRYFNVADLPIDIPTQDARQRFVKGIGSKTLTVEGFKEYGVEHPCCLLETVMAFDREAILQYCTSYTVARAMNLIINQSKVLEPHDENRRYRMMVDACLFAANAFSGAMTNGSFSGDMKQSAIEWMEKNQCISLLLYWLCASAPRLEPSVEVNAVRMDLKVAESLRGKILEWCSCKIFSQEIEERSDASLIQRLYVQNFMPLLECGGKTYRDNVKYLHGAFSDLNCVQRLISVFSNIRWRNFTSGESVWRNTSGDLFLDMLSHVEGVCLKRFDEMPKEDLLSLREFGANFQSRHTDELSEKMRLSGLLADNAENSAGVQRKLR